ncbi:MAG: hypothetical protein EP324_08160 [Gammaproteobacteria bacterium]|nr:MAG: hypothetical protein EP324_08160 [Gammaproteobacteria bacterium]
MIQRAMPMMGEIKDMACSVADVHYSKTWRDAYKLAMYTYARPRRTETEWAEILGKSKGELNEIINGSARNRKPDPDWQSDIENLAHNNAITAYHAARKKGLLLCQRLLDEEEARLEAELAALRARKTVSR